MEIIIEGWRAGGEERKEAASAPADHLPALNDEQKAVAKKFGMSEEAYARSAYAGQLNQRRLIEKSKRLAQLLKEPLAAISGSARIDRIRLVTIEHEYRIDISVNDVKIHFRLPEEMVDDFVEGGSAHVGQQIVDRLGAVLSGRAA
jgi:hypothetical protein